MVTQQEWDKICILLDRGLSISQISRESGRSIPTIYRLIKNKGPKNHLNDCAPPHKAKNLTNFVKYLNSRMKNGLLNRKKLFSELQQRGYQGSYSSLNRYINFKLIDNQFKNYKPSIRFETNPGEQAQVDWGDCGGIEVNNRREKLYCFVYILGFSRMSFVEFTIKQNLQTLQECHIHAFDKIGITRTILYDNPKTVVIKRKKISGVEHIYYNLAFLDFAQYYGFSIKLSPVYWPRTKGKVESGVNYVKNNFLQGLQFRRDYNSLKELNKKVWFWLDNIANIRKHGTTAEQPYKRWQKEKQYLQFPNNFRPYPTSPFVTRNSTKDGLIQYKSNFYSVPYEFCRKKLLIKEVSNGGSLSINIYYEDTIIADHVLSTGRGNLIVKEEHLFHTVMHQKDNVSKNKVEKIFEIPEVSTRSVNYYDQIVK